MKVEGLQFLHWQSAIFKRLYPYVRDERSYLAALGMLSIVTTAANALLIWMLGVGIAQITAGDFPNLDRTLVIIAVLVLFNQIINFLYSYNYQRVTLRFVDRVRGQLLTHIMYLSYSVYLRFTRGDLIARLTSDVDRLLTFVVNVPLSLFSNIVVLAVYLSMLFWIDWHLALIALIMAPMFFLSQRFVAPKTGKASRKFVQERANLLSIEQQTLENLKGISSFTGENLMREKHATQFDIARRWALKVRKIRIVYNAFFTFMVYFAGVVVIYTGISRIESGHLTVGVLVSFLIYIRNLAGPVRSIAHYPIQLQASRASADRVIEVLNTPCTVQQRRDGRELEVTHGSINFDNVSFHYPNSANLVFSKLSMDIPNGESVALVGASGSGKSTFAALLLRFFDPEGGSISIDGVDIKTVSLASLRRQISIVWQEPFIIDGSIRDNLLLAQPGATTDQMIAACESSFSWEFIAKMEDGLDTRIGTQGISLSTGQKQRLAIAQAFLRDTPILVFDEASSALDSHSEKRIVEALQVLRKNRTTLIIAHRFSSIRAAQRIMYFNGNGSVSVGTHEELMANHRDYNASVSWQTARVPNEVAAYDVD